jgi:hypothetical protein
MTRLLVGMLLGIWLAGIAEARDRALLIGVSAYDNDAITDLQGPPNDVTLVWRALRARGMAAADIMLLAEPFAAPEKHPPVKARPTRDNIVAAFKQLADDVARDSGGTVVVYYSGHGAYQADQGNPEDEDEPEPNGLDQVLLPADAGGLDLLTSTIERAIVDDEIGGLLAAIRKHAFVWAVFDSCHSGTVTRGQDVARGVDPSKLAPESERANVIQKLVPKSTTRGGQRAGTIMSGGLKELVGFYAVDAQFQAIERSFAGYDPDMVGPERKMGVFTYNLLQALADGSAATYRELAREVVKGMKKEVSGGAVPPPVFDGGGLDKPLLGTATSNGAPRSVAIYDGTSLAIKAGALRGFDAGARIAIYAAKGGKEPIGHADIDDADAASAKALNVKWLPSVDQPDEGEEVRVAVSEPAVTFRFAVSPPTPQEEANDVAKQAIELAFGQGSSSAELGISLGAPGEAGDVLLHIKDGRLWIQNPRKPWVTESTAGAFDLTPNHPIGSDPMALAKLIKEDVWRLAKAAKLVRVAGAAAEGADGEDGLSISAFSYRNAATAADPKAVCGTTPDRGLPKIALMPSEPVGLANCDFIEIKIANESETTYYIAAFYVNALGGIDILDENDIKRGCVRKLAAGAVRATPYKFFINTWNSEGNRPAATGEENVVILAVPEDETKIAPVLCTLIQPSIAAAQQTRAVELAATRGSNQALGRLIGGIAGSETRGANTKVSEGEDGPRVTGRVFVFDVKP